jgi:hypothetical protein
MSKVVSLSASAPEPEKPKTLDEQVATYRRDYRRTLNQTATVLTLPLRRVKTVLMASLVK